VINKTGIGIALMCLVTVGCLAQPRSQAVYVLLDRSGAIAGSAVNGQTVIRHLLRLLQPGDNLAVAAMDSANYSAKDRWIETAFALRPMAANHQKRIVLETIRRHTGGRKDRRHVDAFGALLHAVEYLNHTGAKRKYIVFLSELQQAPPDDPIGYSPLPLDGIHVVVPNPAEFRMEVGDTPGYFRQSDRWREFVERNRGTWHLIRDYSSLESLLRD